MSLSPCLPACFKISVWAADIAHFNVACFQNWCLIAVERFWDVSCILPTEARLSSKWTSVPTFIQPKTWVCAFIQISPLHSPLHLQIRTRTRTHFPPQVNEVVYLILPLYEKWLFELCCMRVRARTCVREAVSSLTAFACVFVLSSCYLCFFGLCVRDYMFVYLHRLRQCLISRYRPRSTHAWPLLALMVQVLRFMHIQEH